MRKILKIIVKSGFRNLATKLAELRIAIRKIIVHFPPCQQAIYVNKNKFMNCYKDSIYFLVNARKTNRAHIWFKLQTRQTVKETKEYSRSINVEFLVEDSSFYRKSSNSILCNITNPVQHGHKFWIVSTELAKQSSIW